MIIDSGKTHLCIHHYVEQEDEGCLLAYLKDLIESGEISENKELQIEVKKQKKKIYDQLKANFDI